ncbi:MAG: nucleotidyltransferase domain-containing protein [Bacteroidetes bacterium]|nr:MAG: nucleotidyltransferase domain-containing protein [Bacteroidota bacterium]
MNERDRFGLTERDRKTLTDIFKKYPSVKEVRIFGSRAKGAFKLGSDIDLAIMNTGVNDREFFSMKSDFEDSTLPYKVDIVNYPKLSHDEFIEHIDRVGILFYKRDSLQSV